MMSTWNAKAAKAAKEYILSLRPLRLPGRSSLEARRAKAGLCVQSWRSALSGASDPSTGLPPSTPEALVISLLKRRTVFAFVLVARAVAIVVIVIAFTISS